MIHASVELVEAMRGECPDFPFEPPNNGGPHARKACAPGVIADERVVWGYTRGQSEDNFGLTNCPACLALMRLAIGPERLAQLYVRWDQLQDTGAEVPLPWWYERERSAA